MRASDLAAHEKEHLTRSSGAQQEAAEQLQQRTPVQAVVDNAGALKRLAKGDASIAKVCVFV